MVRVSCLLIFFAGWCSITLAFSPPASKTGVQPGLLYEESLRKHGLSPDLESLLGFLERLHPAHPEQLQIEKLILQLGDESFRTRREAMHELSRSPELSQIQLASVESHSDREIQRRAKSLREKQRSEGDFVLFSVLRTLKLHAAPETIPVLFPILPQLHDSFLLREARETVLASVRESSEPFLLDAVRSREIAVRSTALVALGRLDSVHSKAILLDSLSLADDRLAIAAAEGIAFDYPEQSLATLSRLLESPSFCIRHQAASLLQTVTHKQFGYAPYANDPQRNEAAIRWQKWIESDASTVRDLTPLRTRPQRTGRILLCLFRPFTVMELDESGNEVFRSSITRAACGGEADRVTGHRFFSDWERKAIIELDAYGQNVKEPIPLPGIPNSLNLLENGHLLAGIYNRNLVCEVKPDGTVVWEANVDGQPSDARRLANGNTLVALNNRHRVIEIDNEGTVVWELNGSPVHSPESARRLDNGNTLVACGREGSVKEFSPDGTVIWETRDLPMAYDAIVLDNGHLLIGYQSGLRELDRGGNLIRELPVGVVRRIHRY
ncbi:MAG TPA: PQQ-binding-like beta-propeller repeat protein [Planctomycetaceae bacterium]|nr:PQQ-binding-like beta-propeller repeat protein [Planctomycetaceae bacterium]